MKKIMSIILLCAFLVSSIPSVFAQDYYNLDLTQLLTYGEYGEEGEWWDYSDAKIETMTDDGIYLKITNEDINASISADDLARDLLDLHADTPITAEIAAQAKAVLSTKRALGTVNNGLFSNKIMVNTQSTKIDFTVRFDEIGAFIELSNTNSYGPYINTQNGNITVNTGYQDELLVENFDPTHWYKFTLILHDGRDENPLATGSVTVKDLTTDYENTVDGLKLTCKEIDFYKVNFFPANCYGKTMGLKDFAVAAFDGITPTATQVPEKTPYPTLKPTPTPTMTAATPKPTIEPVIQPDALSKNAYTMGEDFNFYESKIDEDPQIKKFVGFGTTIKTEKDDTNNKFITISNANAGLRYYATADSFTKEITAKAVTEFRVKFNSFAAHTGTEMCTFDLVSNNADNQKSDDSKLTIALKIIVDKTGNVYVSNNGADTNIGTVSTAKWYTIKTTTDVSSMKHKIDLYDGDQIIRSVNDVNFYDATANAVKNIRINLKRGSGNVSLDDVYMYEQKDSSSPVFDDMAGDKALLSNYFATYGIAKSSENLIKFPDNCGMTLDITEDNLNIKGTAPDNSKFITATYNKSGVMTKIDVNNGSSSMDINIPISGIEVDQVKCFAWNDLDEMKPLGDAVTSISVAGKEFAPNQNITAKEMQDMIKDTVDYDITLSDTSRESVVKAMVEVYKAVAEDDDPVKADLTFTDLDKIKDTTAISQAVALSLSLVSKGKFEPDKLLTRYEALQCVSRLITAINIGITDKLVPPVVEPIVAPHVIDQIPEVDVIRDPMVEVGPDGYYYMCCTTGTSPYEEIRNQGKESAWQDNIGIKIWRSQDMVDWEIVSSSKEDSIYPDYIWNVYEGGTWEKINGFGVKNVNDGEQRFGQIVWAPEIHWVKGTYFIIYCMHPGGTSIARSVSGRPEGPYVRQESSQNTMFKNRIDASLFWDDDNTVYYTDGSCAIWRMNDDMTRIALKSNGTEDYIGSQGGGKEGGYLFKRNGIYYATSAEFVDGRYDSLINMNKTGKALANGSYKERHSLYTCGHNGYFEDNEGNWWATMFGNDKDPLANSTNGFNNGFALVPIKFDEYDGRVLIDYDRLLAWTDLLQTRGYKFNK